MLLTRRFPDLISLSSCTQLRTLSIRLSDGFEPEDFNWDVLRTVTSPYLKEIKVISFNQTMIEKPWAGWEEIDELLCRCHDRSHGNNVMTFHVSLHPMDVDSEDNGDEFMGSVREAWPRFLKKGTVNLCLESQDGEDVDPGL